MNLHHLKAFFAVANAQSFSKASKELQVCQPTVSVLVKNLEQELGVKLYQQIGKKIYLTDIGSALSQYARRVFAIVDEAEQYIEDCKGLTRGKLLIGASTTPGIYLLPQVLGQFKKSFPSIETVLEIGNSQEMEEKILTNELEVAVVGGEGTDNPNLVAETITQDKLVLVVASDHHLAQSGTAALSEILRENFVVREPGSSTRVALEQRLQELGKEIKITMQFGSLEAIKQAVIANLGVSVLSKFAIEHEVTAGQLQVLEVPDLEIKRNLRLIHHKDRQFSEPTLAFLRLLKENVRTKSS